MIDPAASSFTTIFQPLRVPNRRTNFDDTLIIAKYLVENIGPKFAHIGVDNALGRVLVLRSNTLLNNMVVN